MGKNKKLKPEDARALEGHMNRFEEPGNKALANRESFQDIVSFAVSCNAVTRQELIDGKTGLDSQFFSNACNGLAPKVSSGTHKKTFGIIREKTSAVLAPAVA